MSCRDVTRVTEWRCLSLAMGKPRISPEGSSIVVLAVMAAIQHAGIILYMLPANERRRYIVTSSVIGWAHTQNDPWTCSIICQICAALFSHDNDLWWLSLRICTSAVSSIYRLWFQMALVLNGHSPSTLEGGCPFKTRAQSAWPVVKILEYTLPNVFQIILVFWMNTLMFSQNGYHITDDISKCFLLN